MAASDPKSLPSIGFLTAVNDPQQGWIGGYLVLNQLARPIEFHCTAPVRPNRAQEILYGPTLASYLLGEVIGQTLVKKSDLAPLLVCTDLEDLLAARGFVPLPMALMPGDDQLPKTPAENKARQTYRFDEPHRAAPSGHLLRFEIAGRSAAVNAHFSGDRDEILARIQSLPQSLDLCEPFERIREAIAETQLRR